MLSIYSLRCKCGEEYIGSTVDLDNRKAKHRTLCFRPEAIGYDRKVYSHLRECGMTKDDIVLNVLEVDSERDREYELINSRKSLLNQVTRLWCNPVLNIDEIRKRKAEYYEANKEELRAKAKVRRDNRTREQKAQDKRKSKIRYRNKVNKVNAVKSSVF